MNIQEMEKAVEKAGEAAIQASIDHAQGRISHEELCEAHNEYYRVRRLLQIEQHGI